MSIDHNMDAQYQRTTGKPKLHISVNPRAIPLAMIIMGKSIHGFSSVFYMGMGLGAAEAPLLLTETKWLLKNVIFDTVSCSIWN